MGKKKDLFHISVVSENMNSDIFDKNPSRKLSI